MLPPPPPKKASHSMSIHHPLLCQANPASSYPLAIALMPIHNFIPRASSASSPVLSSFFPLKPLVSHNVPITKSLLQSKTHSYTLQLHLSELYTSSSTCCNMFSDICQPEDIPCSALSNSTEQLLHIIIHM